LRVVRKGLGSDDRVIINGLVNARPGSKVTVQTGDMNQSLAGQVVPVVSVNPGSQPQTKGQGNGPENTNGSSSSAPPNPREP